MPATIQKIDPFKVFSVPCVVLGLGAKEGAHAPAKTSAQFLDNHVKGWSDAPGKEIDRDEAGRREGANTYLRVSTLKGANSKVPSSTDQDGGNGSGGDAASRLFNADMIDSPFQLTFWKRDSGDDTATPLGSDASPEVLNIFKNQLDPGFARFFPSHHQALEFISQSGAGAFLHQLFENVLVVAVRADEEDFASLCNHGGSGVKM